MTYTATIKKGEKQYIAVCHEVDVVSQGYTIEEAIDNLKEAVDLYMEETGTQEEANSNDTIVVKFEVKKFGKTPALIR
jgi:predicted RNase H-like HicB family nuclease